MQSLWLFQNGGCLPFWIKKNLNFDCGGLSGLKCFIMANLTAIRWTVAESWWFNDFSKWQPSVIMDFKECYLLRYCDFSIFQNDGRPLSWICFVHVWITEDQYLVVFISVQNLAGIDAIVSIISRCYLTCLVWKWWFSPKCRFLGISTLNGEQSHCHPKRHLLVQKHVKPHIEH